MVKATHQSHLSSHLRHLSCQHTDRMLGNRMLLMPPSFTLILRHRLDSVCGVVLFTFLAWTHCVARPKTISPTLFSSATHTEHAFILLLIMSPSQQPTFSITLLISLTICTCSSSHSRILWIPQSPQKPITALATAQTRLTACSTLLVRARSGVSWKAHLSQHEPVQLVKPVWYVRW